MRLLQVSLKHAVSTYTFFLLILSKMKVLISGNNEHYYTLYGADIVERYRPHGLSKFGEEFYARNGSNGSPVEAPNRQGKEPTFWEFVMAVIDGGEVGFFPGGE